MTPWIHGYMHISEKRMLIMCVDNCLVFVQNNLFRILLSGIVNFICFTQHVLQTLIVYVILYHVIYLKMYLLINNIVTPKYVVFRK